MTDWTIPTPPELEAVLIPDTHEVFVGSGRDRHIIVSIALWNTFVSVFSLTAVGPGMPTGPTMESTWFRLVDDEGTNYQFVRSGSGGSGGGSPHEASTSFHRPNTRRPKTLTLIAETLVNGQAVSQQELLTVAVPAPE